MENKESYDPDEVRNFLQAYHRVILAEANINVIPLKEARKRVKNDHQYRLGLEMALSGLKEYDKLPENVVKGIYLESREGEFCGFLETLVVRDKRAFIERVLNPPVRKRK